MEIWHGQEGLDVYEEIHQNIYNELTHVIFLPGVFYGVFRGVPSLLSLISLNYPKTVIFSIMSLYSVYYSVSVDIISGLTAFLTISPYAFMAYDHLKTKEHHISSSVIIAFGSLFIQEVVGHSLFEETNSRLTVDYVFNAIMFSPLYYALNVHKIILILQFYFVILFL